MKSTMTAAGLLAFAAIMWSASQPLISAEPNPKAILQQARNDVRAQHLAEAAAAYEKVVADSSKDGAKYKADALYELLLLRVSASPAVRDLQRGAAGPSRACARILSTHALRKSPPSGRCSTR